MSGGFADCFGGSRGEDWQGPICATDAVTELMRHGTAVNSVFDLLGAEEDDLTAVLGFALSQSSTLLAAVVRRVADGGIAEASLALDLSGEAGRTDVQITLPGALLILEAKRDWMLPAASSHRTDPQRRVLPRLKTGGSHLTKLQTSQPSPTR